MNNEKNNRPDKIPKNRHRSRVLALQTLYACEVGTCAEWETMLTRISEGSSIFGPVVLYARELLAACYHSMKQIDEVIKKRAANWDIKRMAAIDRNILRLAVAELQNFKQVPVKVVIDEAVELAKAFGTDESGKFVNGIIDSIHKNMTDRTPVSGKEGSLHGTDTCQK